MKGIDVSVWNGVIDWAKVKADGVEFVYIKSSTGVGADDKNLVANYNGARKAGLKIGFYHYATLNNIENPVRDAKSEADWFLANLKKYPTDLPAALDIEDTKGYDREVELAKNATDDKKEQVRLVSLVTNRYRNVIEIYVDAFQDAFDAAKQELIIYSYAPFLNTFLPLGTDMKLWLAGYTKTPILPKAWKDYFIWQYTDKGRVAGISTNVDMNIMKQPIV